MNLRAFFYTLIGIGIALATGYGIALLLGAEVKNVEQHLVTVIWLGSVYSLFALGYALVFSILGVLNLSHSAVFMWGAFIGLTAVIDWNLSLWLALPIGMFGAGLIGIAVDVIAFAPLRKRNAPRISQLISSIGAASVLVNLSRLQFSADPRRFPGSAIDKLPFEPDKARVTTLDNLGIEFRVTPIQIAICVIALVLMIALQYLVARTKTGKAMRVVAFNQRIAGLLSINVGTIYRLTFFLAGTLAGAAGVMYGLAYPSSIEPYMGEDVALKGLTVIVLGGLGNMRGAVAGGFLVAAVEVYAVAIGYSWLKDATVFTALFLILLIRPQGLLGEAVLKRA